MTKKREIELLRREVDSLAGIIGQFSLKIFGTEVYLDKPIVSRLYRAEQQGEQNTRRLNVLDDCVTELVEQNEKKT
jgi:hypothetical protein